MEGGGGGGRSGWIWGKRRGMLAKGSESGAFGASNTPLSGREWGGVFLKMEMESLLDTHVILDLTAPSCVDLC